MKKNSYVALIILIFMLSGCAKDIQTSGMKNDEWQTREFFTEHDYDIEIPDSSEPPFMNAYMDFLLTYERDEDDFFAVHGYYLFDLDFDGIPELGILHHSGGSMGGYFKLYRFNGNEIVPISDNRNMPARISNYTQILADYENEQVYLLKQMYLLRGNNNGLFGNVSEIVVHDGVPYVHHILDLYVDEAAVTREISMNPNRHIGENNYLSDAELNDIIITRYFDYNTDEWIEISSAAYLQMKMEILPDLDTLVDLRNTEAFILFNTMFEYDFSMERMSWEEIDALFSLWFADSF